MAINKKHLLVPFLMGQRRQGLGRVRDIDDHAWEILAVADFTETDIADANEKLRRMGQVYALLSEAVKEAVSQGQVPVSIAGDCISTLGVLGGLQRAGKPPDRILWLDAHGDFHTWQTTQTKYLGGMPLAMLVGRGDRRMKERDAVASFLAAVGVQPYPEEQVILSDARDLDPGEREAILNSKVVICSISDVSRHLVPGESLYLHFDTDVIDAEAELPALKYHVKQGPTYSEMATLFQSLRNKNIIAVSVSAWHEEKDLENKAAIACMALLKELE
ncbi:arginase family protein [Undibacterium sp.]|jgi:arginase|uniref:arginase family protein n=1 Tax=Undibacterium sp. TaxID=1914977 RepID=UPI002C1DCAB6|nr:arginase family protein [Undibacterium sp.]HTD04370.1 arginase family protein [Undibacterium sp.]